MSQGSVLPPAPARAAHVAAAGGRDASSAADPAWASFGDVLQAQIDKGLPVADAKSDVLPALEAVVAADPAVMVAGQTPIDAALVAAAVAAPVAVPVTPMRAAPAPAAEGDAPAAPMELPVLPLVAMPEASEVATEQVALPAPDGTPARTGRGMDLPLEPQPAVVPTSAEPQAKTPAVAMVPIDRRTPEPVADGKAVATPQPSVVEAPNPLQAVMEPRRDATGVPLKVEVTPPVNAPAWRDAFADKVTWVAQARQPMAELQLNPPQLGPVEIRVSMNADQANLSFFSPHAAVREAIQASLPRLTDAFAASGLTLGNVLVGAESQSGQQPGEREAAGRYPATPREDLAAPPPATAVTWLRPGGSLGRIDLFA